MSLFGLILGAFMLLVIGSGHILIIKGEYHYGTKLWPIFLLIAFSCIIPSILIGDDFISGILGILGFTFLWSIHELFKQKERVKKGWFPMNPKKRYDR